MGRSKTDVRKEAQSIFERLITLGKKGDLHSRRQALNYLNRNGVKKIFDIISKKYTEQTVENTRLVKLGT